MQFNTTTTTSEPGALEVQTFAGAAHTLQTAAIAALIFFACTYVPKVKQRMQLAKLPAFSSSLGGEKHRQGYLKSAKDLYSEGYQKVRFSYPKLSQKLTNVVQRSCLLDEHI